MISGLICPLMLFSASSPQFRGSSPSPDVRAARDVLDMPGRTTSSFSKRRSLREWNRPEGDRSDLERADVGRRILWTPRFDRLLSLVTINQQSG
ncbi:hypothetical protein Poly21_23900 [Allorhodopirellula heiligendammensis]|uniref:Uncharacterized protein n=1 Tax=Allorhodopirellula heiligendammensis TaxID=2714739 RepID=A0A5C6BU35_9BACT|nr:hypothetical protein Poly21_23900 [Allorhodopirellula heiligendammensis]